MVNQHKQQRREFGRRKEPHRIIIAKGDHVRSYTVRPWLASTLVSAVLLFSFGYISATGYLVYRDQILSGSVLEKNQLRQAYEDRIADLRREIDQITSRQMVQRRTLETRIEGLQDRQNKLMSRQSEVDALVNKASQQDVTLVFPPLPETRPELPSSDETIGLRRSSSLFLDDQPSPLAGVDLRRNRELASIGTLYQSLETMESRQNSTIDALMRGATSEMKTLQRTVAAAGVSSLMSSLPKISTGTGNVGGPYEPLRMNDLPFQDRLAILQDTLNKLDISRREVARMPFRAPLKNGQVTSRFGPRIDPFLKRPAMHSGIDYRSSYGTPIRTTGSGVVTKAERMGGYGLVVEVSHGHGLSTRYAHMSLIKVKLGQSVEAGDVIGKVGSSGRSTGPHLHYETRLQGKARNPSTFIEVGRKLKL
ncbi:peptidoglycan DD-metalloendopeptidase family protein [Coralliovum pocilloporae]|uniref:peptidoglycan DD-metalloendopeptidase family protein n=1 Tax=Coralliovum pocilloporae TaxID=3066369 RepID=UPI003307A841